MSEHWHEAGCARNAVDRAVAAELDWRASNSPWQTRAMRGAYVLCFALFIAGCSSAASSASGNDRVPAAARDPGEYQHVSWPEDWPEAKNDAGEPIRNARVAEEAGDRQVVLADSAAALFGHQGQLTRTIIAFGSHCGMNVAQLLNTSKSLGAIGNDAGIGLHSSGAICIPLADDAGIPVATVSADTAYIGEAMSLWTSGKVSLVNETAKRLGITVGMSAREAASIMLEKAAPPP